MNRFLAIAALATTVVAVTLSQTACSPTSTQTEQQSLVDRATLTVQDMMTQNVSQDPKSLLRRAKAVMVCPRIFKAGFFFGGEGGNCVLLARAGNGTWSYPAFYTIGSGSFGLQFGIADNQLLMLIMTEKGLNAVLDSQIKLGANAGIAIATIGAGIQGSTTAAVGPDIVAFAASRGLFGGIALEGSLMSSRFPRKSILLRTAPRHSAIGDANARQQPGRRPDTGPAHPVRLSKRSTANAAAFAAATAAGLRAGLSTVSAAGRASDCATAFGRLRGAPAERARSGPGTNSPATPVISCAVCV